MNMTQRLVQLAISSTFAFVGRNGGRRVEGAVCSYDGLDFVREKVNGGGGGRRNNNIILQIFC